jgi:hypothetical protein
MEQWEKDNIVRDNKARQDGEAVAKEVSHMLNGMGGTAQKAFIEYMTHEHRTIQQLFTKQCLTWLRTCGSPEYNYDGRNEASADLGRKIVKAIDDGQVTISHGDLIMPLI